MFDPKPGMLKDYTVFNPDFYRDVMKFMELQCTEREVRKRIEEVDGANPLIPAQVEAGELTVKERLNALVDRIEFIGHLERVSRMAKNSNFLLNGKEVKGIHWDIAALRLYLALTCIDIFCEESNHKSHFEAVFSEATDGMRERLNSTLSLRKSDGTTANLKDIGLFFYNVRNYYTHSGKRFHILEGSSLAQEAPFMSGSKKHKQEEFLMVTRGTNLVDLLLSMAISLAKQCFGWDKD